MSGIAGIIGRVNDAENRAALARMSAAMAHRGPDAAGQWISAPSATGDGVLLAHRLLSVLDDTQQPVVEGRDVLLLDGSVLSHPRVGDVLAELRARGRGALPALRGTFGLAWWNDDARQLTLARDPLGQKPLYYARGADPRSRFFAFASELRALLASQLLAARRIDHVAAASYLWNGFVMSPHTLVRDARALLPGESLVLNADGTEQSRRLYWSIPRPGPSNPDERAIREALRESVKLNLRRAGSSAPAVLLSGGIDSSSIANLAQLQRGGDAPIKTYCLAMEDAALSEGEAARQIAQGLGTEHHEVMLTEDTFVRTLDHAIASLDQPSFDALNQYHICRALREAGIRIALGGIGGDGIFGGDKTLRLLPRLQRIAACTAWLPESVRVAAARLVSAAAQRKPPPGGLGSQQGWAKLPDVARAQSDLLGLYQLTYALFLPDFQHEMLAEKPATAGYGLPRETHDWLSREIEGHKAIEVAAILETRCFVGERLLRDADSVSSALSFELRSPLADARIIEALGQLPVERKFLPVGYKPLLRKYGLEGVEPSLYERPKSGFVLPFERWMRSRLGAIMDQAMRDAGACAAAGLRAPAVARLWDAFQMRAPGLYWSRIWSIYVLLRWCQQHRVHA